MSRVRRSFYRLDSQLVGADTHFTTSTEELVHLIRAFGKTPVQRDTY